MRLFTCHSGKKSAWIQLSATIMSNLPENLKYTKEHEWIRVDDDGTAFVGITDHAQESLGDITFVEMPELGNAYSVGDAFGVVESVKAASDLYMPIDAEILEVNESLESEPEKVNNDPYQDGWMVKIKITDASQLDGLLTPEAYQKELG